MRKWYRWTRLSILASMLVMVALLSGCSGFGGDRRIAGSIGIPGFFMLTWGSSVNGSYPLPQAVKATIPPAPTTPTVAE
jgi:hypothetical protein